MLPFVVALAAQACRWPFPYSDDDGRRDAVFLFDLVSKSEETRSACEFYARRTFEGVPVCVWTPDIQSFTVWYTSPCESCIQRELPADADVGSSLTKAEVQYVRQCTLDDETGTYGFDYTKTELEDSALAFAVNLPPSAAESGFAGALCQAACSLQPNCSSYELTGASGCALEVPRPVGTLAESTTTLAGTADKSSTTAPPAFSRSDPIILPARTVVNKRSVLRKDTGYSESRIDWAVITDETWQTLEVLETDQSTNPQTCGELCHADATCHHSAWIGPWDGCKKLPREFYLALWWGPNCGTFLPNNGFFGCSESPSGSPLRHRRNTDVATHPVIVNEIFLRDSGLKSPFWYDPFVTLIAPGRYYCYGHYSHVRFINDATLLEIKECEWIEEVHILGQNFVWRPDSFAGCPRLRRIYFQQGFTLANGVHGLSGCVTRVTSANGDLGVQTDIDYGETVPNIYGSSPVTSTQIECIPCDAHPDAAFGGSGRSSLPESILRVNRRFYADCPHITRVVAAKLSVVSTQPDSWPRSPNLRLIGLGSASTFNPALSFDVLSERTALLPSGGGAMTLYTVAPCAGHSLVVRRSSVTDHLFQYCESRLVWMDGVETIGEFAFADMPNLKSVQFPETIVSIDGTAFRNTQGIQNLLMPAGKRNLLLELAENIESGGCDCEDGGLLCQPIPAGDGLFGVCECTAGKPGCFFDIDPAHHQPRRATDVIVGGGVCGDSSQKRSVVAPVLEPASERLFDLPGTVRVSLTRQAGAPAETVLVPIGNLGGFCDGSLASGLPEYVFPQPEAPLAGAGRNWTKARVLPAQSSAGAAAQPETAVPDYALALIAIGSVVILYLAARKLALV